jgi:hypothetical protein
MGCTQNKAVAAMCITVLVLFVPTCPKGHHWSLAINGVKMTEQAHVWVLASVANGKPGLYLSNCISSFHEEAVAVKCATVLLLSVPLCPEGHHLSVAMYGVKMTEQAHMYG